MFKGTCDDNSYNDRICDDGVVDMGWVDHGWGWGWGCTVGHGRYQFGL